MAPPAPASRGAPVDWSRKAIASVVFGLLGFATLWLLFGLIFSAAGALFGHLARHDTLVQPLRGRRLAAAGLTLGYGGMLLFPLLVFLVGLSFPAVSKWRQEQEAVSRAASQTKASRLFVACEDFARSHRDRYPSSWQDLAGRFLPRGELDDLLRSPYRGGGKVAFELVRHDRPVLEATADSVIVLQEIAPATVPEIAVVYANGRVARLHNPDYESP